MKVLLQLLLSCYQARRQTSRTNSPKPPICSRRPIFNVRDCVQRDCGTVQLSGRNRGPTDPTLKKYTRGVRLISCLRSGSVSVMVMAYWNLNSWLPHKVSVSVMGCTGTVSSWSGTCWSGTWTGWSTPSSGGSRPSQSDAEAAGAHAFSNQARRPAAPNQYGSLCGVGPQPGCGTHKRKSL